MLRRLLKFLHTMGAIGLMGAMASLLVMLSFAPAPTSLAEYALLRAAMGGIATWIFLPSLALTLIAGLLAIAVNRSYHDAGWALAKLATGVLLFEYGLLAVQGPMQQEATLSARACRRDRCRDARQNRERRVELSLGAARSGDRKRCAWRMAPALHPAPGLKRKVLAEMI